mmetsp:Transcript_6038/g.11819  ORF Transcript_6038/g.11819 Transcript_6038/m.11819 type:complete len:84 (-) Transcript_6038:702-953(-)
MPVLNFSKVKSSEFCSVAFCGNDSLPNAIPLDCETFLGSFLDASMWVIIITMIIVVAVFYFDKHSSIFKTLYYTPSNGIYTCT